MLLPRLNAEHVVNLPVAGDSGQRAATSDYIDGWWEARSWVAGPHPFIKHFVYVRVLRKLNFLASNLDSSSCRLWLGRFGFLR